MSPHEAHEVQTSSTVCSWKDIQLLSVAYLLKTQGPDCVRGVPLDAREYAKVKSELSEHNGNQSHPKRREDCDAKVNER